MKCVYQEYPAGDYFVEFGRCTSGIDGDFLIIQVFANDTYMCFENKRLEWHSGEDERLALEYVNKFIDEYTKKPKRE